MNTATQYVGAYEHCYTVGAYEHCYTVGAYEHCYTVEVSLFTLSGDHTPTYPPLEAKFNSFIGKCLNFTDTG